MDQKYAQWKIKLSTPNDLRYVLFENNQIYREIHFRGQLSWDVLLFGNSIAQEIVGIPTIISTNNDLDVLVETISHLRLCFGVEDNAKRSPLKDITGNKKSEIDHVSKGQRSLKCCLFLRGADNVKFCSSCQGIRDHLRRLQYNYSKPSDEKGEATKRELKKTRLREQYWREKAEFEKSLRQLCQKDNEDLLQIYQFCDHKLNEDKFSEYPDMELLWSQQKKYLDCAKGSQMRWHPKIIKMCLSLWHRSKRGYEDLASSGFLKLPSTRLLQYYKSNVKTLPGLHKDRLNWMVQEAEDAKLSEFGKTGAIIFDEMSIQSDVQMKRKGDGWEIVGLVNLDGLASSLQQLEKGHIKTEVATHVIQFIFLGNTGFRFPFCYYATKEISVSNLFVKFWEAVDVLEEYSFHTRACICDGAGVNRAFVKMHFPMDNEEEVGFTTVSPSTGKSLTFIMDPSHNFKKIRNALEKSKSTGKSARHFIFDEDEILWSHLIDAYEYDIATNTLQTHRRLTSSHFELTSTSRMRNYLADDVLGEDMVELMLVYQRSLKNKGKDASYLNKTVEFLQKTSKLLKNFKHQHPYMSLDDNRFVENDESLKWVKEWENTVKSTEEISKKEKNRRFLSDYTKYDLLSMVVGFKGFCKNMFHDFNGCGVTTARTNQDVVENFFCQARSFNGQNSNPSVLQYESGMNAITQMQPSTGTSSKGNCAKQTTFFKERPLSRKRAASKIQPSHSKDKSFKAIR